MLPLVGIGIMAIVIVGIIGMYSVINNQQEISDVNEIVSENTVKSLQQIKSVSGYVTKDGNVMISNDDNDIVRFIQFRLYDDDGILLDTFSTDEIISSHTEQEIQLSNTMIERLLFDQ